MAVVKCKECGKEVSPGVTNCPTCGEPIRSGSSLTKPIGCIGCLGLIILALMIFSWIINSLIEKQETKETSVRSAIKGERQESKVEILLEDRQNGYGMLKYRILCEDVIDVPIATQVTLKVLVSGEVSEPDLKALLNKLYFSIKERRGFKYRSSPTSIYIYAFTSEGMAKSSTGQWIAVLKKCYDDPRPVIEVKESQVAKFGQSSKKNDFNPR